MGLTRMEKRTIQLVAQLMGVSGRDAAEALKGATVQISRSLFPPLADDEFYWVDLIGLSVWRAKRDGGAK